MLILTRKIDESIIIDDHIEIQVLSIDEGKVKLGIKAPKDVKIHRSELIEKILESNKASVSVKGSMQQLSDELKKNKKDVK